MPGVAGIIIIGDMIHRIEPNSIAADDTMPPISLITVPWSRGVAATSTRVFRTHAICGGLVAIGRLHGRLHGSM